MNTATTLPPASSSPSTFSAAPAPAARGDDATAAALVSTVADEIRFLRPTGLRPTAWWTEYFGNNQRREWGIPWRDNPVIAAGAWRRIARSIAEFQRGESSEARDYMEKSRRFAERAGDADFHEASVLFVREENEHAALLLRFMRLAAMEPKRAVWSDGVFRRLRARADLGWKCRTLIVAEFVAQEYYPRLREIGDHPVLRRVCDKLIADEVAHIRFQVERIAAVEADLPEWRRRLRDATQGAVLLGATLVVYAGHRGVLGGMGLARFWRGMRRRHRRALATLRHLRAGRTA